MASGNAARRVEKGCVMSRAAPQGADGNIRNEGPRKVQEPRAGRSVCSPSNYYRGQTETWVLQKCAAAVKVKGKVRRRPDEFPPSKLARFTWFLDISILIALPHFPPWGLEGCTFHPRWKISITFNPDFGLDRVEVLELEKPSHSSCLYRPMERLDRCNFINPEGNFTNIHVLK